MRKVFIFINAEAKESGKIIASSPVTERMVMALKKAITADTSRPIVVEVVAAANLWSKSVKLEAESQDVFYCPLTIQLPDFFDFSARAIYQACLDIEGRRLWVEQNLAHKTSIGNRCLGDLWLPVVWTRKGPLYGAAIEEGAIPNSYQQPVDLSDKMREPLYHLAERLLKSLSAPPAVYLLQFSLLGQEIVFDRLWPFPAAPAIASLRVQQPDLFTCHWYCLTNQPLLDLRLNYSSP
jgi:hypothetical protein